jgi:hypothetical protein
MRFLWTLALFAALAAFYFVYVRPRLSAANEAALAAADGFWARLKIRVAGFRTLIIGFFGVTLPEFASAFGSLLGSLLEQLSFLADVDLSSVSPYLPEGGVQFLQAVILLMMVYRAKATGPIGAKSDIG